MSDINGVIFRVVIVLSALFADVAICSTLPTFANRLEEKYCSEAHANPWQDLVNSGQLREFTLRARGIRISEAPYFWCAVRRISVTEIMWPNDEGFYLARTLGQLLAIILPNYIWNDPYLEPYSLEDEDALEALARGIININDGIISPCALSVQIEERRINVLRDLAEVLGEKRSPLAELRCKNRSLLEIAAANGNSADFGKILSEGHPFYHPSSNELYAAVESGSMQMLEFLIVYSYEPEEIRHALQLAQRLHEPLRSRALALVSGGSYY
ncbi:MAG: hypothetical protein H7A19_16215 [Rhodanobacteraceae bacterium]|nr:hypothetical protein [Rhodanobacteraceae bacterium]